MEKHQDATVVIIPGAASSKGVITALEESGFYGKAKIFIYDLSTITKESLLGGQIAASIDQYPRQQGYEAIKGISNDLTSGEFPSGNNQHISVRVVLKEHIENNLV